MLFILMFFIVVAGVGKSLKNLWDALGKRNHFFSFSNLILLTVIYGTVLLGFGLLYISLEVLEIPILHERGEPIGEESLHLIEVSLYFSAITLLSVGYGDVVPLGIGRWIAMIEALVGYVMPAAFIFHSLLENEKR